MARGKTYALFVIGFVACAMLVYEILLTRVCALRLDFHYSFLVVGNGLLAVGAAGSVLFLLQDRIRERERAWLTLGSVLFLLSLPATYAALILWPVEAGVGLAGAGEVLGLFAFSLVASLPFFFGGGVIGAILFLRADEVNRYYAVDLLAAGLGCLLAPLVLWYGGAGGCLALAAALASAAGGCAARERRARVALFALALICAALQGRVDRWMPVPSKRHILLSEDVSFDTAGALPYSRWSAISRVDLFPVPAGKRYLFGEGPAPGEPALPEEQFILQDGSAGTYILDFTSEPAALERLGRSAYATASSVKQAPRVFVIGVGGGNDVWAARHAGAARVKGVELNEQILDIHGLTGFSRELLDDPSIELVHGEGRSMLMRETEQYDVIQMSGIDTWTALTSGGYMLAENFLYTVEAFEAMFARLAPGGILQVTRTAQDVETLRLLVCMQAARERSGAPGELAASVACLYTHPLMTLLVKLDPFTEDELERLDAFAAQASIPFIYHPGRELGSEVEAFIRTPDKAAYVNTFPLDITPTTDDRPYFFHFNRWSDPLRAADSIEAPPSITQGNPLFLFGQLGLALLAGLVLTLGPLFLSKKHPLRKGMAPYLVYFTSAGLGFIAIELAAMQKLVLLLGHPLYSITVTLFAMLIFTGLGSWLSAARFREATRLIWIVPIGLALWLSVLQSASPLLIEHCVGWSWPARFLLAAALLAPLGLLLGIPFAHGIQLLEQRSPAAVPWAWAVNACATVVGSVATVIVSINFGFSAVFAVAVGIYAIGAACLRVATR